MYLSPQASNVLQSTLWGKPEASAAWWLYLWRTWVRPDETQTESHGGCGGCLQEAGPSRSAVISVRRVHAVRSQLGDISVIMLSMLVEDGSCGSILDSALPRMDPQGHGLPQLLCCQVGPVPPTVVSKLTGSWLCRMCCCHLHSRPVGVLGHLVSRELLFPLLQILTMSSAGSSVGCSARTTITHRDPLFTTYQE